MAQKNTKVPNKSSGDSITSAEFNNLNTAINSNAADAQSKINSILNTSPDAGNEFNEQLEEASKFWLVNDMEIKSDKHWLITKMFNERDSVTGVGEQVAWMAPHDGIISAAHCGASTAAVGGNVSIQVKKNGTSFTTGTISAGSFQTANTLIAEPVLFSSGDRISFETSNVTTTSGAAGLHADLEVDWNPVTGDIVWVAPEDGKIHSAISTVSTPPDGESITIDVKRNGLSILEETGVIPNGGYSTILGTPHELDADPRVFLAGDVISFENIDNTITEGLGLSTDIKISMGTEGGVGQFTVAYEEFYNNPTKVDGDIPINWKNRDPDVAHLKIGKSVETIGSQAFYYNFGLTGPLLIPSNVRTIGAKAFDFCNSITSLNIEYGTEIIESSAFQRCINLTGDLVIPNSVTTIGFAGFFNCNNLAGKLTLGTNLVTIANSAFEFCNFTGDLVIPNSVTTIGFAAFSSCNFESLVVPNSVTSIDQFAFRGSKLNSIYVDTHISSWSTGCLADQFNEEPITMYVNNLGALGYTSGSQTFQGENITIVEWQNYPNPVPN